MPSLPTLIFMSFFFLGSLVAMLQNGFIVTVLGRAWARDRSLPTGDIIVTCLAASRFCLHGMSVLNNLLVVFGFYPKVSAFNIPWDFVNTLTFWFTGWLAFFYCVKISSFSHPVFLWLKWRISQSVPRLLLGSLVISGVSVSTSIVGNLRLGPLVALQIFGGNNTLANRILTTHRLIFLPHLVLVLSVPFVLFLVSTLLLMYSLHRHLGKMKDGRLGQRDPSTQAHTMALKSLAFFLIFYTSYFLSIVIVIMKSINFPNHWHWVWEVVTYAGICLHSSILILSSPKLRKALKMRLRKPC
ncbi:taste receptor type 2 member 62-like [Sorex fumeus]|uniref:taste receptor type 2 member 62-like n=1 Tax=Sorex fumeus TaxID=62283 RepID=UPI0024AE2924|nr:taste receptor type 2 member 62-like [Sorex fumeus]